MQNTFQQLFLDKIQFFQQQQLAAQKKNFVLRGREQQYTLNQQRSTGLVYLSCKSPKGISIPVSINRDTEKYNIWFIIRTYFLIKNNLTYCLPPRSQNIVPNIMPMNVVKKNLTAVYGGLRQYDKRCFHKQAWHWTKKDCEN
jgi:hypothetical protein